MMTDGKSPQHGGLSSVLLRPVDNDTLIYFRIVFAVIALSWVAKQLSSGAVEEFYSGPDYHFHYFGFHWVRALPGEWIPIQLWGMGLAALLIGLGAWYRVATTVFAIGFTQLFLMDKCLYQNHYYLLCLVSWLLVFVPADAALSVDSKRKPSIASSNAPTWVLWLLRFQLGLPYFFGGIAKINPDWLAGEPMRMMLGRRTGYSIVGQFFDQEWCVYLMAYGALLFDLLVVPAMLTRRFRRYAISCAIVFHVLNSQLFTIGVFPWFMLLSLPIYFEPGCLRWLLTGTAKSESDLAGLVYGRLSKPFACVLILFVIWQTLFPLRHFAMPGNPSWTEEGHYFAWHMLLRGKQSALRFTATDPSSGKAGAIDLRPFVTEFQLNRVSRDPRMIHELAQYVGVDLKARGFDGVELRALSLVSMNGRMPQLLIDPDVDLLAEPLGYARPSWVVPLAEPLRLPHWDKPLSAWEAAVLHQ